jgi:hypothetical protein
VKDGYYSCRVTSPNGCVYEVGRVVSGISATSRPADVEAFYAYPNPAAGRLYLYVRLKEPAVVRWSLVDVGGTLRAQRWLTGSLVEEEISLDALPAGLYFLQIETPQGAALRTIVIRP